MGVTWSIIQDNLPWGERYYMSLAQGPAGRIWASGGGDRYGGNMRSDVWYSDDDCQTWTQATSQASWLKRRGHSFVVTPDGKLWVIGGICYDPYYRKEVMARDAWYSYDGATWTQAVSNNLLLDRANAPTIVDENGVIWLFYGITLSGINTQVVYSPDGCTWTQGPDTGVTPCPGLAAVRDGNSDIWILGSKSGSTLMASVVRYSRTSAPTRIVINADWSGLTRSAAAYSSSGGLWLAGGERPDQAVTSTNEVWYSRDGVSWIRVDAGDLPPFAVSAPSVLARANQVTIIMGPSSIIRIQFEDPAYTWDELTAHTGVLSDTYPRIVAQLANGRIYLITDDTKLYISDDWATWTAAAPPPWAPRFAPGCADCGGTLWVSGGEQSNNQVTDIWYTTDGATWTQFASESPWGSRINHLMAVGEDGTIWILGGESSGAGLDDVWCYKNGNWSCTTYSASWGAYPSEPPRQLLIQPNGSLLLRTTARLWTSPDGSTWSVIHDTSPVGTPNYSITQRVDGTLFAATERRELWVSCDYGITWSKLVNAEWSSRTLMSTVIDSNGNILVIGGYGCGQHLDDVWKLDGIYAGSTVALIRGDTRRSTIYNSAARYDTVRYLHSEEDITADTRRPVEWIAKLRGDTQRSTIYSSAARHDTVRHLYREQDITADTQRIVERIVQRPAEPGIASTLRQVFRIESAGSGTRREVLSSQGIGADTARSVLLLVDTGTRKLFPSTRLLNMRFRGPMESFKVNQFMIGVKSDLDRIEQAISGLENTVNSLINNIALGDLSNE